MTLLEKWITALESWIGTPYVFEGARKKVGSNCSQFALNEIIDTLGVSNPQLVKLRQQSHRRLISAEPGAIPNALSTFCRVIPKDQMQPGDLVVIEFAKIPLQVVIYKGDGIFIFCTKGLGVVEDVLPGNLERKIISVWRPKCLEEGN